MSDARRPARRRWAARAAPRARSPGSAGVRHLARSTATRRGRRRPAAPGSRRCTGLGGRRLGPASCSATGSGSSSSAGRFVGGDDARLVVGGQAAAGRAATQHGHDGQQPTCGRRRAAASFVLLHRAARPRSGRRRRRRRGPRPTPGRRAGSTCSATRARPRPTPSLAAPAAGAGAAGEAVEDRARGRPRARRRRGPRRRSGRRRRRGAADTPVAPPPYLRALSSRLAITRTRRRLSAWTTTPASVGVELDRARRRRWSGSTAWITSSARWTSSSSRRTAPASKREISSRSSTSCWKRSTSATIGRAAAWARVGHLVAPVVQHLDRGGQGHQRRAQLVAHVGREAGVALDAVLEGLGHVVERRDERTSRSGSSLALEAGVEPAAGDGLGGRADARRAGAGPGGWPTSRARRRRGW